MVNSLQGGAGGASAVALGGTTMSRAATANFRAEEMRFAPDLRLASHYHAEPIMTIPLLGALELTSNGRRVVCRPGTVFTVPAGERHSSTFGRAGARSVVITAVDLDDCLGVTAKEAFRSAKVVECPPVARLGAELVDEAKWADPWSPLAIDGIVMQIAALTLRADQRMRIGVPPTFLKLAVEMIYAADSRRLTLAELATAVDVAPSYLARAFRAVYGTSIVRFARTVRFERAVERLGSTTDPIRDIALAAGFADQSHFTRVFRRIKGVSPARYRRERSATCVATSPMRTIVASAPPSAG